MVAVLLTLSVALIATVAAGASALNQVISVAGHVERSEAVFRAYLPIRDAVVEQAFAEASYRRSPNPETRARLLDSLGGLEEQVELLQTIGRPQDQGTVIRMLALNSRYVAEVRRTLDERNATSPVSADDRVAGPALDALKEILDTATVARREELDRALAAQRDAVGELGRTVAVIVVIGLGTLATLGAVVGLRHRRLTSAITRHSEEARRDPLTGLANRRAFEQHLDSLLAEDTPGVALVMLDLDGLKGVNDNHGHPAGDALLVHAARCLTQGLRRDDLLARLGGDEFAVVTTAGPHVGDLAERLLDLVTLPLDHAGTRHQVTASIGLAVNSAGRTRAELLAAADEALYRAKRGGRNRIERDVQPESRGNGPVSSGANSV